MYRIKSEKAERLLEQNDTERSREKHYLFGRNGLFSFEETGSVYTVVETDEKEFLIHDFDKKGKKVREVEQLGKDNATDFLKKTGHRPFMKLDIEKYRLEERGTVIEKVDQLGYFISDPEIGQEKVHYGEELKQKMMRDTAKHKEVRDSAEEILRMV